MIVRCQLDLVNTNESILPVSDKPYHINKVEYIKGRRVCETVNCCFIVKMYSIFLKYVD